MSDLAISYDLLFDILRYEKSKEELYVLEKDFYGKVVEYLKQKESSMLSINTSTTERELTRIQLNNIKRILQEIYERRERKIINLAIYTVKTDSNIINVNALLPEEKIFYDNMVLMLSKYRNSILNNLLNNKMPFAENIHEETDKLMNKYKNGDSKRIINGNDFSEEDPEKIISVRFIKPVPKFLGPEMEIYGPFIEDDIASLPYKIAKILINNKRAERIVSE
ncbi:MAG: hypothetical protein QXL18_04350 [Candidatus Woesearchaeota archaeon]